MIDPLELGRAFYEVECKLGKIETKLNNIQNRIYELLEKVDAIGMVDTDVCGTTITHWNNETRAKYGLPPRVESKDE